MLKHPLNLGGISVLVLCLSTSVNAATFYVDPVNGSASGDGSAGNPWADLQDVIEDHVESEKPLNYPYDGTLTARNSGAAITAGDTILLMSGDHGAINLYGWYNTGEITIEAAPGETPVLQKWILKGGKNWTLRGLTISAEPYGTPGTGQLVSFEGHGWHGPASQCTIEDSEIYTVDDISSWTATDWTSTAASGIKLYGDDMTARGNLVRNISFGIAVGGDDGLVEYNEVINFSGDGLRGLGDYGVFQYNLVMNCYDVDGNHDDGFQSWADDGGGPGSGVRYGIELRGNIFIETDDPTRALNGPLQGIGCFDGMFEDWVIENNVVAIDQWHGITLLGATDCTIVNNTVVDLGIRSNRPWIEIGPHKNGSPSTGNVINNNITRQVRDRTTGGVTQSNNIIIDIPSYSTYFIDHTVNDYRLVSGSPAIDAGTSSSAPADDLMGDPRPQGSGYDVGAYEFAPAILIEGASTDTQLNDDGSSPWVNNQSGRVGGSTGTLEGVMVYVFELPVLAAGETILNANLDFTLLSISNGTFAGEGDLYGIAYRSSSAVLASDFYNGTYGGDTGATELQQGIMSNTQALGVVSTDATGDWNLTDFLNDQYDNGATGGDYVFLRVNSSETDHSPYRYWSLATANHSTVANRPVLSVEIGDE
ncbi:choice-of-anchor Q domain-containing protein [Cerasicoccus fimbriatus]|uniref:choice-of-anchor Q domain-containing protein n=1 Tax=Cerasicoccus fimbriatus TaxID=3014554 RepID=UPI0022B2ECC4|nr:choice-of-anchor Q domain-containing protein [Cerasicoccus sp. TK19100]